MVNRTKITGLILVFVFSFCSDLVSPAEELKSSEITVEVRCEDEDKGRVYVALHDSEKTFPKKGNEAPHHAMAEISKGKVKVTFKEVPEGTYALSAFFDENGNGKLDCNFLGIPKERAGVSNNYSGLPKWLKSKFTIKSHTSLKITIDLSK